MGNDQRDRRKSTTPLRGSLSGRGTAAEPASVVGEESDGRGETAGVTALPSTVTGTNGASAKRARTPPTVTTDQRARGLARAHAQRAANRARWAGVLRRDFLDEGHWLRLARQAGVTLPRWDSPPTPARITQFVGKLNRSVPWYLDHAAVRTLNDFRVLNPTWPMRALAGLLLEAHCQQQHLEPAAAPGSLARLDPAHTDTDNARQRKAVRVTGRQQQGPHQQPRRT